MKITKQLLNAFVEERYRDRGKEYFKDGLVELLSVTENHVKARSLGSRRYETILTLKQHQLSGSCNCPAFDNFGPCKHIAAVAYAVIKHHEGGYSPSTLYNDQKKKDDQLYALLMKKKKSDLVDLLINVYNDSEDLQFLLEEDEEDN